jgi:hypothetical protein
MEVSMLRPLAVAIGLALCLSGSSSAYAGTKSVLFKEAGWAWKYLAQELTYKNGKVILSKPIRVDLFGYHYERSELNPKPALWAVGGYLWGTTKRQK